MCKTTPNILARIAPKSSVLLHINLSTVLCRSNTRAIIEKLIFLYRIQNTMQLIFIRSTIFSRHTKCQNIGHSTWTWILIPYPRCTLCCKTGKGWCVISNKCYYWPYVYIYKYYKLLENFVSLYVVRILKNQWIDLDESFSLCLAINYFAITHVVHYRTVWLEGWAIKKKQWASHWLNFKSDI